MEEMSVYKEGKEGEKCRNVETEGRKTDECRREEVKIGIGSEEEENGEV